MSTMMLAADRRDWHGRAVRPEGLRYVAMVWNCVSEEWWIVPSHNEMDPAAVLAIAKGRKRHWGDKAACVDTRERAVTTDLSLTLHEYHDALDLAGVL